jgi:hypothetical protein
LGSLADGNVARLLTRLEADLQTHLPCLKQQASLVLEAQRAGEVGERALDCWRGEACEGQLQRRRWRGGGAQR